MKDEQQILSRGIQSEMVNASARMKAMELLDGETEDYQRGFRDGYNLNQERVESLNEIYLTKDTQTR